MVSRYTLARNRTLRPALMFDHLLDYEPPIGEVEGAALLKHVAPADIVAAQQQTEEWLRSIGAPTEDTTPPLAAAQAQEAFTKLVTNTPTALQREAVLQINTPPAVRHLVGMLTAYDWAFVERAKELRGYAVAQILEETKHPDAKIRLRALEMLGKVTEVALFTDRVEVKRTTLDDTDLDAKIKEKLARFTGVVDIEATEVAQEETQTDAAP